MIKFKVLGVGRKPLCISIKLKILENYEHSYLHCGLIMLQVGLVDMCLLG